MRVELFAFLTFIGAGALGALEACSGDVGTEASATASGSGGHGGGGTSTSTATATSTATSTASATASASSSDSSSASTGGGVMCGASTCGDVSLLGFVTLPGCCPANAPPDKCGLDLTSVSQLIMLPLMCVELNQAGDPDATCPTKTVMAMGQTFNLPGCCRPNMVCGNEVDLSAIAPGTNFGCIDSAPFLDSGAPPACGGGGTGGAGGAGGGGSTGSSASSASGSSSSTGP